MNLGEEVFAANKMYFKELDEKYELCVKPDVRTDPR